MKDVDTGVLAAPSASLLLLPIQPGSCTFTYLVRALFLYRKVFYEKGVLSAAACGYIREGTLHVEYEGETFDAKKGDVVLLDCARPHYYQAMEGLEFVYIHFDGSNSHEICGHILKLFGR